MDASQQLNKIIFEERIIMELIINDLTKKYGSKVAVNHVSCKFSSGQLVGLIGSNGAGKTTFIKLLTTILKPTTGNILINNQDVVENKNVIRKLIGYLPQEVCLYDNLSAFEYLNYMASIKGLNSNLAEVQIFDLLERLHLTNVKNKALGSFSGGMKQRVGIAGALLGNPQIIIFDEPTVGLDPQERIAVRNILSELSRTKLVILSTHIVTDIEAIASKIIVMKTGNVVFDGKPEELIKSTTGYVWEYTVPKLQMEMKMKCVSNMIQTENGVRIRQISRKKPMGGAIQVEAKLEDACLYMLEG